MDTKEQIRRTFDSLRERLLTIDLGIPNFKKNNRILETKLVFNNGKSIFYSSSINTVSFGLKYLDNTSVRMLKKLLIHELLHAQGLDHNHKYGFYSMITKDIFSSEVMKKMGLIPPSKEEIKKHCDYIAGEVRTKKITTAKYIIKCEKCDFKATRTKKSKLVTQVHRYRCPRCSGKLKIITK